MKSIAIGLCVALIPRKWLRRVGSVLGKVGLNETDLLVGLAREIGVTGAMVDVGARYGTSLAPFAREGRMVFAFEPDPDNRRVLRTVRRRWPDIVVDPRAVSDSARSDVPFFTSSGRSSISSLLAFDASHAATDTVDVVTLEEALSEHGLSDVGVLKVDAEGNDLRVLRGLNFSGSFRPTLIMCEFDGSKVKSGGHTYEELCAFLSDAGYRLLVSEWCPVTEYGGQHQWKALGWAPHPIDDPLGHGNIIAVDSEADIPVTAYQFSEQWAEAMSRDVGS